MLAQVLIAEADVFSWRCVTVWGGRDLAAGLDEASAECMLVLIGATAEGKKELVSFQTGVRDLADIKRRGLEIEPDQSLARQRVAQ
jgi:putative transposase